jgi:S1-C subfamily serine protease
MHLWRRAAAGFSELAAGLTGEVPMRVNVIRTVEEARAHDRRRSALVEVPGELVPVVVALTRVLRVPIERDPGRRAGPRRPSPRPDRDRRPGGVVVTNIGPGSQAAKAGMARGDILLRYDGVPIDRPGRLKRLAERLAPGGGASGRVVIEGMRGPTELRFEVRGGPLGMTVSALYPSRRTA